MTDNLQDPARDTAVPVLRAGVFMMGAVASFTLMAVAGRQVSFELDTFEIMMFRSIVGLVVVMGFVLAQGRLQELPTQKTGTHLLRNVFHFTGQNLWFFAITMIPLAQVFALEFTTPLWVLILSPLMLGERMTRMRVIAAVLGFIGILIVARPTPDTLNIGTAAAAACAIGFAGTYIFAKRLTRTESLTCILFWMTVMQAVFGLVCAGYDGDIALPSLVSLPWLVAIGICGLTAHFCITSALALAPATLVSPIDFMRLPVIAIVGLLVYDEAVSVFVFVGAALIFGANYLNLWSETRKR